MFGKAKETDIFYPLIFSFISEAEWIEAFLVLLIIVLWFNPEMNIVLSEEKKNWNAHSRCEIYYALKISLLPLREVPGGASRGNSGWFFFTMTLSLLAWY